MNKIVDLDGNVKDQYFMNGCEYRIDAEVGLCEDYKTLPRVDY